MRIEIIFFVIISMSSNFLQRFKGKTQTLSKQGVQNILGSKNIGAPPVPPQPPREQVNSTNKAKSSLGQNITSNSGEQAKNKTAKQTYQPLPMKPNKTQNPFLVSNPFYLDEEEKQREQIQRKQRQRIQQQTKKALQAQKSAKDPKEVTKTTSYSKSLDKKKDAKDKEWVRLGGLGANIGGDQWIQRKKKQQKMQQFAGQVKSINAEKIKPRPDIPKPKQKQVNPRQKALQYSKNIPKPVIRKQEQQQYIEVPQRKQPQNEQGLTQLQIYQMKHEQLKKMIHNHY